MPKDIISDFLIGSKEKVIQLLSESPSLSTKQIHYRLQRHYSIQQSYQATHKTLKQLILNGTLIKKDQKYSINPAWVEKFKMNAEQLAERVKSGVKEINFKEIMENESVQLSCNGILDAGWFLVDKIMTAPNPNKKPCLALWRFCYSLVGLEEKHLTGLKEDFKKNKWHAFIEENNKVDQMFGKTLLSYGLEEIKYGVKCATPLSDKMIIGDYIAEITYPSTFRKLWAIQNRLPKRIVDFNLGNHFINMRELQPKIEITITRNSQLAEEYRKEYLKKN